MYADRKGVAGDKVALNQIASKRLASEIKKSKNAIIVDQTDLSRCEVVLQFPPTSKIGQDLLQLKNTHGNEGLLVQLEFPFNYPMKPPFLRIVSPRLKYNEAGITFGGTVVGFETLSEKTWTPVETIDNVIDNFKKYLIDNNAQVDFEATQKYYTIQEAKASQSRVLITSQEIPTQGKFKKTYLCGSSSSVYRDDMLIGNKVLLPESALKEIDNAGIEPPFCFEIKTNHNSRTYCGVLEFTSEEGFIILPDGMMKSLFIQESESLQIRSVKLPLGEHVIFQPHSTSLLSSLDNDKNKMIALLEWVLPKYSTLAMGDTIEVQHGGKIYLLNVIETKPASAISLYAQTYLDIKFEFVPALDYVEPQPEKPTNKVVEGVTLGNAKLRESQSVTCKNCMRQVPIGSSEMHMAMCARMNIKCPRCDALLRKGELDNHFKDAHSMIKCECGSEVEKIQMEEHKKTSCNLRFVSCKYCNYTSQKKMMNQHEESCGTKTQICDICNANVMKKDYMVHMEICRSNQEAKMSIDTENPLFHCPICEIRLQDILSSEDQLALNSFDMTSFIQHVKTEHINDLEKVECPICLYQSPLKWAQSSKKESLIKHIEIHELRLLQQLQWQNKKNNF